MTLDVWLVARLCAELREAVVGARIAGVAADGTGLRLACYRRGSSGSLRVTFGPEAPLLAYHRDTTAANEKVVTGWAGGVAPLLRGSTVESVLAVPDDRVVFLDLISRSPFGVPARHRIALELEPNKSNALVLRRSDADHWQILAAAKEIEGAQGARSIVVGEQYEAPPPRRPALDRQALRAAVGDGSDGLLRALVRALGQYDTTCSPALAREVVERVNASSARGHTDFGSALLAAWKALRTDVSAAASDTASPAYAWLSGDSIETVHLVPLTWPAGPPRVLATVNEACAQAQTLGDRRRNAPALTALVKRLQTMLSRCAAEKASLEQAQRRASEADDYRRSGEAIYAYLALIPDRADGFTTPEGLRVALDPALSAKENAASYFRRFKKARSGLPRIAQRLATLESNREYWEGLLWEAERARDASPEEAAIAADEIGQAIGARRAPKRAPAKQRPAQRAVALADGATAYVGRSPKDNERVTFSQGGPDDWWFHTRGIPGAHVILKLADPRATPTEEQIVGAAALAAGQSRAADAQSVEVDYTQRKHVRKQGGGRVGLVWYTDFKTVRVAPRRLPPAQ